MCLVLGISFSLALGCGSAEPKEQVKSRDLFIAARKAVAQGDSAAAIQALDASIEAAPSTWAYFERAKIKATTGDDEGAVADCNAGLELDPRNQDFKWLLAQLKKPLKDGKRVLGDPPSYSK